MYYFKINILYWFNLKSKYFVNILRLKKQHMIYILIIIVCYLLIHDIIVLYNDDV